MYSLLEFTAHIHPQTSTCPSPRLHSYLCMFIFLSGSRKALSVASLPKWIGCQSPTALFLMLLTFCSSGNIIAIVGTGLAIIGLTWGGIRYSWASAQVLAPLIIGFSLLFVFALYEVKVPSRPTIPLDVVRNRTSLSGHVALFVRANPANSRLLLQASDYCRSRNR